MLAAAHVGSGTHLLELGCGTMPQLSATAALLGRDGLLRRWADRAVAATMVQPPEAAAWLADTLAPHRAGALLAIPIIVTAGSKPGKGTNI